MIQHQLCLLTLFFRHIKVNAAFAGEPIPSEESILKKVAPASPCLILYIFCVTLYNSTCSEPFLPQFDFCMRTNFNPTAWQNSKLLMIILFTFIIGINILLDLDAISKGNSRPRLEDIVNSQNSPPVIDESPVNTSCISVLFFGISIFLFRFLKSIDSVLMFYIILYGSILVILLIKGPLITLWTIRQLQQKGLKKNEQKKDVPLEELTLSEQAQYSQLENHNNNMM